MPLLRRVRRRRNRPVAWRLRSHRAPRLAGRQGVARAGAQAPIVITGMNQARFERLQDVFQRALDVPPDARRGFVEKTCAGDTTLLLAVTAMLEEDARSTSFLDRGVGQAAGLVFDRTP